MQPYVDSHRNENQVLRGRDFKEFLPYTLMRNAANQTGYMGVHEPTEDGGIDAFPISMPNKNWPHSSVCPTYFTKPSYYVTPRNLTPTRALEIQKYSQNKKVFLQMKGKRKSTVTDDEQGKKVRLFPPQLAWCPKVLQIPKAISTRTYSSCLSREGFENFRRLTVSSPLSSSIESTKSLQTTIRNSLRKHGLCVINRLMGENLGDKISQEVKYLHSTRACSKGRLMGSRYTPKRVRQDVVTWVSGSEPDFLNLSGLCAKLDEIVGTGGGVTEDYNICGSTKAMVAKYAGNGARYQLHVDNPAKDGRCLTCIYYLNKNWDKETMGGSLILHAKTSGRTADIQPIIDRIVFFYSDKRNPHEVLPAFENRFAVTLWYFDQAERMRAIQRMSLKNA